MSFAFFLLKTSRHFAAGSGESLGVKVCIPAVGRSAAGHAFRDLEPAQHAHANAASIGGSSTPDNDSDDCLLLRRRCRLGLLGRTFLFLLRALSLVGRRFELLGRFGEAFTL